MAAAATAASDPAKQPAEVEHGYPHGHLGHLTAAEEAALSSFKALLLENGLYRPEPTLSHDDQTLL